MKFHSQTLTCPLCDKLSRVEQLPDEELVWEFPHSVALLGPWQYHTGYCILVARAHAVELHHLPDSVRRGYLEEMCLVARAIDECFRPRKMNYEALGNQVAHLHWHLFPRRHDDPDALKAVWLGFERAERDAGEKHRLQTGALSRTEITARLRKTLQGLKFETLMNPLRIGTRSSPLALWQARHVSRLLRAAAPEVTLELVEIQTTGDQVRDVPLAQLGGEGVFTKAIQQALQENRVDIAVHSLKDLPTFQVANLVLAAVPPRGPVGDAFVAKKHRAFSDLPAGAIVASSSLRRRAQVHYRRPDLKLVDMRGNVETRLRKLMESDLDAIVLAQAGLERLQLAEQITEILEPSWMLPAVGQGALALECRGDDARARGVVEKINDAATRDAVLAERALLRGLGGGCQVPIGAVTIIEGQVLTLKGVVLTPNGQTRIASEITRTLEEAESMGQSLAEDLLAKGARQILGFEL